MSKNTLQDRMDEIESSLSIISKEVTEVTEILKCNYSTILKGNYSANLEAIAAKIINDLLNKVDRCECSIEILNYLNEKEPE